MPLTNLLLIPLLHSKVSGGAVLAQSPTLQRLGELELIEDVKWRGFEFGENYLCRYYWPGWRLDPSTGVRSTLRRCQVPKNALYPPLGHHIIGDHEVQVRCADVKIREKDGLSLRAWGNWRFPGDVEGERSMIAALCDNLLKQ
jgi:hypothetical protein